MKSIHISSVACLSVLLAAACVSPSEDATSSESWMPVGADAEVVDDEQARQEAQEEIDEQSADAAYDDLVDEP